MDKVMAIIALAVLVGFLGILLAFVPRLNLALVLALALGLAIYDFLRPFIHRRNGRR